MNDLLTKSWNITDKYEIKEVLGEGMASCVKRCICKSTGAEFAVKIINIGRDTESSKSPSNNNILKEALNEIALLHECAGFDGIIKLHDVFETDTSVCLVLDLLSQGELFDCMLKTKGGKFPEARVKSLMRDILQSVCDLHSLNIMHRDIKAENILLDEKSKPHLSDFGLATKTDESQLHTEVCGTPSYMAPEIVKCAVSHDHPGYQKPVDVWACGVLMYQLLSGRRPFDHRKQLITLRRIRAGDYSFPFSEWRHVSDSAKDLIRRLLDVNPHNRVSAAQALQHAFFTHCET